jgi:hypothetical protein
MKSTTRIFSKKFCDLNKAAAKESSENLNWFEITRCFCPHLVASTDEDGGVRLEL